ncbi:MAG: hypothetical protein ACPHAS_03840 [Synechococcus sp.]
MPLRIVLPIGMVLLMQGCAGSPIAQDLEQRFSDPAPITAMPMDDSRAPAPQPEAAAPTRTETAVAPKTESLPTPDLVVDKPVSTQQPQPYRITIRLSAADPSAPAELVTRALRSSNVPFAVERIESIAPTP